MWWLLACSGGDPEPVDPGPTTSTPVALEAPVADAGPDRQVRVGEPVMLEVGPEARGVAFRWDFGDGTQAEGAPVSHTWTAPGTYTVVVEARGEDGSRRTDAARVVASLAPAAVPPVASATVAVASDGLVYVLVPEAGAVSVVDGAGALVTRRVVCAEPRSLAIAGAEVAVACAGDDRVLVLDRADLTERVTFDLGRGAQPLGVAGRDGAWVAALAGTGEVATLSDAGVSRVAAADPRSVALLPDGDWLAPRFRSPDGEGRMHASSGGYALAFDPGPDSDTGIRGVPNLLQGLAISPDGGFAYVPGLLANTARGAFRDGLPLTHETTVHAVLIALDLATGAEVWRKQFDDQGQAGAVVASPAGDVLFVTHPGTATIHAIDAWDGDIVGSLHDAGDAAQSLALSADGRTLYVDAWLDRELRAYDVSDLSRPPPRLWSVPTVDAEPLAPVLLQGKRVFHDSFDLRMAQDGYMACAVCHPDGDQDGLVWDFTDRGEGLRNTTSLLGRAGTGMGPVHWSGNFDEIRGPFGGAGFLSEADWAATNDPLGAPKAGLDPDLDALAAYVTSLDQLPPSPHAPDPQGAALFTALGCDTCHPPPLYTDSDLATFVRHDVGTLGPGSGMRLGGPLDGLDTPTLLGAFATGPWLHDGSAATLEDAIRAHTEADAAQAAALAAFVRGL